MTQNRFIIQNNWSELLTLSIEPEGAFFTLKRGEEVEVIDRFDVLPVTVMYSTSEVGEPILSIWPGDGVVRVEKGGVDVFDLLVPQRVHA